MHIFKKERLLKISTHFFLSKLLITSVCFCVTFLVASAEVDHDHRQQAGEHQDSHTDHGSDDNDG